ncbi:hypothetical protein [Microlunatus parietis]|uniref:Bacteriocin biosynthesis cyclodehydratase domain-containing protein n=1 Tax=Microlunatus parietis TaxID=682979 RepID=A0A7Y9LGJ8_9ACTN|nr:hypothetical protein [Microlunatus parietis]NYE75271.1 hypothetical protein [Microlunatus parietis]
MKPSAVAPARPRLARYPGLTRSTVFLRRSPDAVQVGIDTDASRLLAGVAPALAEVLSQIDGRQTLGSLRRAARRLAVPERQLDEALALLRQAGLVVIRSSAGPPADPAGTLSGARIGLVGSGPLADRLAESLTGCGPAELLRSPDPDAPPPDLTVVATGTAEPDRVLTAGLVRADQPHLIVRTAGDLAVVGPFVLPGRSACLRCVDLTRAGADPGWPELLAQLCRQRPTAPELVAGWAVGAALLQVHSALRYVAAGPDAEPPETLGATLELDGASLAPGLRRWRSHPGCGCGWGGPAE